MNANFTKLISSAAAVLAVGSSAFAQQTKACPPPTCTYEQGFGLCNDKYPAAYNAPARIDVQCSWDFYLTGSFLYWHAEQEAMDLAFPFTVATSSADDKPLIQKFEYKPGFKVAAGMNYEYDNWISYAEYTWFHQKTCHSVGAAPSGDEWVMTNWYDLTTYPVSAISSKWKLNIDIADLVLSRPYYQGRKLTVSPFGGLRAAWIRQNLRIAATVPAHTINPTISHNHSHSWGVGARGGVQAHWLLGYGFRIEGDMSASLLATQFTKVTHSEDDGAGSLINTIRYHEYNTIRPMADMGIGLGWGSYFDCQNYHFDLSATYDFTVMWGQNMMRSLVNMYNSGSTFEPGDLHLQGLTATARFDF